MSTYIRYITSDDMIFTNYNEAKEYENGLLLAKANMLFRQGVNLFDAFSEYLGFTYDGKCTELKSIHKDSVLWLTQDNVENKYAVLKLLYSGNILLRQINSNNLLITSAPKLVEMHEH